VTHANRSLFAISCLVATAAWLILPAQVRASHRPAGVSNSRGTPPAPPVVPGPAGTKVPCNQGTQIGLDGCAYLRLVAADKLLNSDIRAVWAILPSVDRPDFVAAQSAWLKYRRADCVSQADFFRGGTIQPMEYTLCLAGDDALRRQDLKSFYSSLAPGLASAPRFP
jgi:uncharacterized protein YecT (DUF1311 family)